jgi:hypothetical protein
MCKPRDCAGAVAPRPGWKPELGDWDKPLEPVTASVPVGRVEYRRSFGTASCLEAARPGEDPGKAASTPVRRGGAAGQNGLLRALVVA